MYVQVWHKLETKVSEYQKLYNDFLWERMIYVYTDSPSMLLERKYPTDRAVKQKK